MPDDQKQLPERLAESVGKGVGKGLVDGLSAGPIAGFIESVSDYFSKAKHPSLSELKDVCKILENYRPKQDNAPDRYKFPARHKQFKREDKTAEQVARDWFRIEPSVSERWIRWMPDVNPYFYNTSGELDYDNNKIEPERKHPIFKKAHSFITTGKISKHIIESEFKEAHKRCEDFVGAVLNLFLDGWREFVLVGHTTFTEGTVLRVRDQRTPRYSQAYERGYFTITGRAPFYLDGKEQITNVGLSRRMLITEYHDNIEVTNVGAIEVGEQKTDDAYYGLAENV